MSKRRNRHLLELPSVPFHQSRVSESFRRCAVDVLLPRLRITGNKQQLKKELAICCLQNLLLAGQSRATVADSRDTSLPGVRLRIQIWDAIVAAGLAIAPYVGSQMTGRRTRYFASQSLLDLFVGWKLSQILDVDLERNSLMKTPTDHALVVIRRGKVDPKTGARLSDEERKQALPLPDDSLFLKDVPDVSVREYLQLIEDDIEKINRSNLKHPWEATDPVTGHAIDPNVCLKQIHVGQPMHSARLYTWGSVRSAQNFPKAVRRGMLIDQQPAAELDYVGFHLRMLYHLEGVDPVMDDVYSPQDIMPRFYRRVHDEEYRGLIRDFIKKATNICINAKTQGRASSSVGRALAKRDELRRARANQDQERVEQLSQDVQLTMDAVYDVERTDPRDLVNRIVAQHPQLARRFFTGVGPMLMTLDGVLMRRILLSFVAEGRPALGLHDAVLCRQSDVEFGRSMMLIHYHAMFGYFPGYQTCLLRP